MQIPNEKLKELLANEGLIKPEDFDKIIEEATRMGQNVSDILVSRGIITKGYLNELLISYFEVGKAALSLRSIDPEIVRLFPKNLPGKKE